MSKVSDNENFARAAQEWLGVPVDGWAGIKTMAAFIEKTGQNEKRAAHTLKDASAFFLHIRGKFGALDTDQVNGFNHLLTAMSPWSLYDTAYGLATAWWETNKTMQPVREAYWLGEDWRKKNLRYYPWYGRGYVQITWKENYEKADKELGLSGALVGAPDRALEPEIAARILVAGMDEGWFTGKKNSDYKSREYVARRKMINGTDHDDDIAAIAEIMESALVSGGW